MNTTQPQTVEFWIDRTDLVNLQKYYNQVEVLEVIERKEGKALIRVKIRDLARFLEEIAF
jgi:hypothetical protein